MSLPFTVIIIITTISIAIIITTMFAFLNRIILCIAFHQLFHILHNKSLISFTFKAKIEIITTILFIKKKENSHNLSFNDIQKSNKK